MSDQRFGYFVLNPRRVCQIKKSSKRLVDGHLGGLTVLPDIFFHGSETNKFGE